MVFFSSQHRVVNLSLFDKVWMYPLGHILKGIATTLLKVIDKFDEVVAIKIVKQEEI